MSNIIFHYPPDLLALLIQVIPLLNRSKQSVLDFFRGAGVSGDMLSDLQAILDADRDQISKFEISRILLTRLNEKGETTLRERRELLKRVTEFEKFSVCWPNDQLKAKGLVAEISQLVNVKDSFTRMDIERESEAKSRRAEHAAKLEKQRKTLEVMASVRADLLALFSVEDKQKRGTALEGILNRLFKESGILVQESFTVRGDEHQGVVEQIDGVIEIDGEMYLVEMKWWKEPVGRAGVSSHLVGVYNRGHGRGIFISASGYTDPAIKVCRESLQRSVFVLCKLEEIVLLLERGEDLRNFLKAKIRAAVVHKNPLFEPLSNT